MTELDLDKLSRLKAPEPQTDARERAMTAAMQAFDDAEKNPDAPQGSPEGVRQSSIFNRIWSPLMNRKLLAGSALATLLVIPVAGLVTLELVRNGTVALAPQEAQVDPVATDKIRTLRNPNRSLWPMPRRPKRRSPPPSPPRRPPR